MSTDERLRRVLIGLTLVLGAVSSVRAQSGFPLGVSAGDVTADSALLWTRAPDAVALRFELARTPAFEEILLGFIFPVDPARDGTVRVLATGLASGTEYAYRFQNPETGMISPVGRFRTAPEDGAAAPLRIAFTGDSNARWAPFPLFTAMAQESLDALLWFGDTIYADAAAGGLGPARTLEEYRAKYRQVLADPHVIRLRQATNIWVGWDDHEVVNDYAGRDPALDPQQLANAYQAFFDYLPLLGPGGTKDPFQTYRSIRYGANAEFFVLDNRQYRDPPADQICGCNIDPDGLIVPALQATGDCASALREPRSMLGEAQLGWLMDRLATSDARWKFVVNSVPISHLGVLPYDRWDGYDDERRQLLTFIDEQQIAGVVFLTTDIHANFYNPDVLSYFRRFRPAYDLLGQVRVQEVITGPIGNLPLRQAAIRIADGLEEDDDGFVQALIDLGLNVWQERLRTAGGMSWIDLDHLAYVVIDIDDEGRAAVTWRGAQMSALEDPDPQIRTLHRVALDQPPALPCFLPVLLVSLSACLLFGRRQILSA